MPSIQAMRSDAMAIRSKEDVLEKIPNFFNSVNQALGQSIVQAQDNTERIMLERTQAANSILAKIKQRIEGKQGLAEMGVNNALKTVQVTVDVINSALGQIDWTIAKTIADTVAFGMELAAFKEQFKAVSMDYVQYTVQAGYTGSIDLDGITVDPISSMGARGMVTHRDALTPRYTDRREYDGVYKYASAGQLARQGRY